jgi:nicotinamidase-related amidase
VPVSSQRPESGRLEVGLEVGLGFELDAPALLLVDLQYGDADPRSAYALRRRASDGEEAYRYYTERLRDVVIPNVARLQGAFREAGREVLFVRIESRTVDGRDRGAGHVRRNIHFPPGSPEGRILAPLAPLADEIVLSKTSDSAFVATGLGDLLDNLAVRDLAIVGVVTGSCVRATTLDALRFAREGARGRARTVVVADATATWSPDLQRGSEDELREAGALIATTDQVVAALSSRAASPG